MYKHLERGKEVLTLYRRGLELSRVFPDPCARQYLFYRLGYEFRRHKNEVSTQNISKHIKDARKHIRRIERSLKGREDYEYVVALAYGIKGRFKHLLKNYELEASQPPKANRVPKYMLAPLPGEARETFSLSLLNRLVLEPRPDYEKETQTEQGGSTEASPSGGTRDGGQIGSKSKTKEGHTAASLTASPSSWSTASDTSIRLQLAVLRHLVPPLWNRRAKFQPVGGNPGGVITGWSGTKLEARTETKEVVEFMTREDTHWNAVSRRKRFREDWMPTPWDVEYTPLCLITDNRVGTGTDASDTRYLGRRPPQAWYLELRDWEKDHLALLTTTFMPDIIRRLHSSDALDRTWRRSYARVLLGGEKEAISVLKVSGVPAMWRGEPGGTKGGDSKLVFRYKDKVVDVVDV